MAGYTDRTGRLHLVHLQLGRRGTWHLGATAGSDLPFCQALYMVAAGLLGPLIGVKSTARLFGENTTPWLRGFLIASVLLLGMAIIAAIVPATDRNVLALVVALAGAWGFGWHMLWQMRQLDRDAGLIPALFIAVAALL